MGFRERGVEANVMFFLLLIFTLFFLFFVVYKFLLVLAISKSSSLTFLSKFVYFILLKSEIDETL